MIQRIQSLYLLASAALVAIATCFNFAIFSFEGYEIFVSPYAISASAPEIVASIELQPMLSLGVSMWLVVAFTLSAIFLYKKRKLQMNFVRYIGVFKIALIAFVAFFTYRLVANDATGLMYMQLDASSLLLIISIITDVLAFFAIRKDERLVRSIDRIR